MRVEPSVAALLARHGLADAVEQAFEHDGWSGAGISRFELGGQGFILKRDSFDRDWIARATHDRAMREAGLVLAEPELAWQLPHLGVARDGAPGVARDGAHGVARDDRGGVALLMPDLTGQLFRWETPIDASDLARVIAAVASLHDQPLPAIDLSWCPLRERILLLSRTSAEGYAGEGNPVGARFLAGWDAFERLAVVSEPAAVELVARLSQDPSPLLTALSRRPSALLHGDLKLGNLGFAPDGRPLAIDWQMVMIAPRAVDLGWLLVSNTTDLPAPPDAVLAAYARAARLPDDDAAVEADLAIVVGLLLRGWRKGLDADAGRTHASGVAASDDLAWWCRRALAAADRRL